MLDGPISSWFADGLQRTHADYSQGEINGSSKEWHKGEQHTLAADLHLVHGQPEGLQTYWHENGQKRLEVTYKAGTKGGCLVGMVRQRQVSRRRLLRSQISPTENSAFGTTTVPPGRSSTTPRVLKLGNGRSGIEKATRCRQTFAATSRRRSSDLGEGRFGPANVPFCSISTGSVSRPARVAGLPEHVSDRSLPRRYARPLASLGQGAITLRLPRVPATR